MAWTDDEKVATEELLEELPDQDALAPLPVVVLTALAHTNMLLALVAVRLETLLNKWGSATN
jgi:hypothetical protein